MKKELFFLLLIFGGLLPSKIYSQAKNLEHLPAKERDSILMAVAKEAILVCGPDYYRDHKLPEISGLIIWQDADHPTHNGRKFYVLIYPQDETRENLYLGYAAKVYIWADTGEVFELFFGNVEYYNLDGIDYRNTKIKKNPYQQAKDMKPKKIYSSPPTNLNHPYYDHNRDSLLLDFSQRLAKRYFPDYPVNPQKVKIEAGQFSGEGYYHGKPCYRVTYKLDKKRKDFDQDYFAFIDILTEEGEILKFQLGNNIEIYNQAQIRVWDICTKQYCGLSTGAFTVTPTKAGSKLDPEREIIDMDSFPKAIRDSLLVAIGKEVTLAIGPTYQREHQNPLVDTVTKVDVGGGQYRPYYHNRLNPRVKEEVCKPGEKFPGRKYYEVGFSGSVRDLTYNRRARDMVSVKIWADTGTPFSITLGNGVSINFDGMDYRKIGIYVPYEDQTTVKALIDKNKK